MDFSLLLSSYATVWSNPEVLLMTFIGALGGVLLGAIPGMTATMGVALLIPFSFGMDLIPSIGLLLGIYCGGMYGGSISAILIHAPGTPAAAATLLDGYPMCKKGQAGKALSVAMFASFCGGVIGALVMTFLSPLVADMAMNFGPGEMFMLAVFGLSVIVAISGKSVAKGLISAFFGMLLCTVGLDPTNGIPRFITTKQTGLLDGFQFIPTLIGLFAVSEVIAGVERIIRGEEHGQKSNEKITNVLPDWKTIKKIWPNILSGGLIGTFIGAIPGAGGDIAVFVSYGASKSASKHPELYGTGIPNGVAMFLRTIPYNYYAILTMVMSLFLIFSGLDYGPMKKHEDNALLGDLFTTDDRPYGDDVDDGSDTRGHVVDLIAPVLVLIAACIFGMVYTGGFFEGVDFITAFADCSASVGLVMGSAIALMFTFVFYRVRGVMTFQDFAACIPEGFKAMVSPMLILTLAWTLSGMTGLLGAKYYVASLLSGSAAALQYLLPIIIFVVAVFLAFATGTSWGTFSILVPIVCHAFPDGEMLVVSIAACLSGAVCGDHCSPISDTTIMASAGAHCSHVNHVSTQLPYAMTAAAISAGCYLLCGAAQAVLGDAANTLTSFVLLACAIAIELVVLSIVRARMGHTGKEEVTKS